MEFPRLVYRSAIDYALAKDSAAYDALLADGWYDSVPEALEAKTKVAEEVEQPIIESVVLARSELEQKATELGIKFDGRTSTAKLSKLVQYGLD